MVFVFVITLVHLKKRKKRSNILLYLSALDVDKRVVNYIRDLFLKSVVD